MNTTFPGADYPGNGSRMVFRDMEADEMTAALGAQGEFRREWTPPPMLGMSAMQGSMTGTPNFEAVVAEVDSPVRRGTMLGSGILLRSMFN